MTAIDKTDPRAGFGPASGVHGNRPRQPQGLFWRIGLNLPGAAGLAIVVAVLALSLAAPWVAPFDPYQQNILNSLKPPSLASGHLLGTDQLGRDLLSRILYGGRLPIALVCGAVAVALVFGVLLGVVAGLRGGWFDEITGRLAEVKMSFPTILLALLLLAFVGVSNLNLFLIIMLTMWTAPYRLARAQAQTLRAMVFVDIAGMFGASRMQVVFGHVLPNMLPVLVVTASNSLMGGIGIFSTLSYLGFGIQPPATDWGQMIASGQSQLMGAWWLALMPAAVLSIFLLGIQLFADWLAERLSVSAMNAR